MHQNASRDLKILRERATAIVGYFRSHSLGWLLHEQTNAACKEVFAGRSMRAHRALVRELELWATEGLSAEHLTALNGKLVGRFGRVAGLLRNEKRLSAKALQRGRVANLTEIRAVRSRIEKIRNKRGRADEFRSLIELIAQADRLSTRRSGCVVWIPFAADYLNRI